jgi:hypothetical protein
MWRGGCAQFVYVGQATPAPLMLSGWSKALELNGFGAQIDYSLYADLHFTDGTKQWAYYVPFDPTRQDWQHAYGA